MLRLARPLGYLKGQQAKASEVVLCGPCVWVVEGGARFIAFWGALCIPGLRGLSFASEEGSGSRPSNSEQRLGRWLAPCLA